MSEAWICLTSSERMLLREALATFAQGKRTRRSLIDALSRKTEAIEALRRTVIRVEGGFVGVENNPNPIVVYDYDCEGEDEETRLPDENGRLCIVSEYDPN